MNQELSAADAVIGVDIGGTKIAAGIVTSQGEALHVLRVPTPSADGAAAILAAVSGLGRHLLTIANAQNMPISGIGIGAGGQIDVNTGRVRYASSVIPGWAGAEIAQTVSAELCLPVRADNDVNVLALGEHRFGAGQPYADVLFVGVGTGVGGAVILNRQLMHGASFAAGEIAHLLVDYRGDRICGCGLPGHLEAYAAGPAIAKHYGKLAGLTTPCELPTVLRRANEGEQSAIDAIQEAGSILGKALVGILAVLDPQAVVIGGGVIQLGKLWWEPLLAEIRTNPLPGLAKIAVHPAQLGQNAAVIGAGALFYS